MRFILAAAVALSFAAAPAYAADPVADTPAAAVAETPAASTAETPVVAAKLGQTIPKEEKPEGATALCKDGTYTKTRNQVGVCSSHKGLAYWLKR